MQTGKITRLEAKIREAKLEILGLGAMRPGHLSHQYRVNGEKRVAYPQLSYTFKKKGHTDYVRAADLERIKSEVKNYTAFKEIIERLCGYSIELSKAKSTKRKKAKQS